MADKKPIGWFTVNGKHVPIFAKEITFNISKQQSDFEESIRNEPKEHLGYFDNEGNKLFETEGTEEEVTFGNRYEDEEDWDKTVQFNREVEQRVWKDEEIHSVHNHPANTIFSPEDVEGFEALENKSMSVVLPNGTNYRLIREQPRSSNVWVLNEKTNELEREFEPKKIAEDYYNAYSAIYDDGHKKLPWWGDPERKRLEAELDKKVAEEMEKWLLENAAKYGYRFEVQKR